jgi:protein O-GlcNAc transferase
MPTVDPADLNRLGKAACQAGRFEEGIALFRRALVAAPDLVETHVALGRALQDHGKPGEAEASYRQALALDPKSAAIHNNLAKSLEDQGRLDEAVASYRRAIELQPDLDPAHFNLGNVLGRQGRLNEAVASYRRAIELQPNGIASHFNLGNALKSQGKPDEAIASYRRAIALDPAQYTAHFNLANVLWERGKSAEAAVSYWQSLKLKPDYASAYNNIAAMLWARARTGEATAYHRRALELAPDNRAFHSNLLFCLQYDPAMTPGALLVEHRAYGASLPAAPRVHANPRDPDKRLNIGYVSPDLHQHPVGFLLTPVLAAHDRNNFAIHCYYGHRAEDGITAFLKGRAHVWRSTAGIGDDAMSAMIEQDAIDILVDLSGHTAENRLPVFARRPAPVQATWAGYEGTTGVTAIDYLITDRWQSPPGSERYAVEKLLRLPDGYLCWAVPSHAPDVAALPASDAGAVTFACLNNLAKINAVVIALWGQLLRQLPASRLVLKSRELRDPAARERIHALFAVEGVATARVVLEEPSPHPEYIARYNDIDIALDPFPFSGGATTIEALWMGVPVVTLGGERFASRHSLSHLNNAGLGELVADSPEAYLRIASQLAHDLPRLAALRAGMRERLRGSPLLRSERFTRGLEQAFRAMWRQWCERAS